MGCPFIYCNVGLILGPFKMLFYYSGILLPSGVNVVYHIAASGIVQRCSSWCRLGYHSKLFRHSPAALQTMGEEAQAVLCSDTSLCEES